MAVAWDSLLLTSSVGKQVNKHLSPWFVLQAIMCRTARNTTDGTHIGQVTDVWDYMLMTVKEMKCWKSIFLSDLKAGLPCSKISKQMTKSWLCKNNSCLSAWDICRVSQVITAFYWYPDLACSLSCKMLWQHWEQALQKLAELYLGKEEEAVLRQRTITASQSWWVFFPLLPLSDECGLSWSLSLWPET